MLEKIQAMLAEALNLPLEKVTPDAKIVDDLGADSLDVVELLSQLEDEYGIIIPDDEVETLVTVSDVAKELDKLIK
ncbi:MAG: acyl carrier protein [Clostridia bacterium]|nr:acyl carrier protein [Clostridia bacterium]